MFGMENYMNKVVPDTCFLEKAFIVAGMKWAYPENLPVPKDLWWKQSRRTLKIWFLIILFCFPNLCKFYTRVDSFPLPSASGPLNIFQWQCKCYQSHICSIRILFYGFLRSTAWIAEPHGTIGHQSPFLQSLEPSSCLIIA